MTTHGILGFVLDQQEKFCEIGGDAYPSGAGVGYLQWLRAMVPHGDVTYLVPYVRRLKLLTDPEIGPSPEEQAWAEHNLEQLSVVIDRPEVWRWDYLEGAASPGTPVVHPLTIGLVSGLMDDAVWMATDSLYCEWGYVADLDRRSFEVYKGFQKSRPAYGRFADRPPTTSHGAEPYYPLGLVTAWPIDALPSDEEFVTAIPCPVEAPARERGLPSRFDET